MKRGIFGWKGRILALGVVHKQRWQEGVGRWSKNVKVGKQLVKKTKTCHYSLWTSAKGLVGVWKMAIFADVKYYLCWFRVGVWVRKSQKYADVIYRDGPFVSAPLYLKVYFLNSLVANKDGDSNRAPDSRKATVINCAVFTTLWNLGSLEL